MTSREDLVDFAPEKRSESSKQPGESARKIFNIHQWGEIFWRFEVICIKIITGSGETAMDPIPCQLSKNSDLKTR
jgi:hypothetical protein